MKAVAKVVKFIKSNTSGEWTTDHADTQALRTIAQRYIKTLVEVREKDELWVTERAVLYCQLPSTDEIYV